MSSWLSSPEKRNRTILIGAILLLLVVILWAAWTALVPFFLGLILAYLLLPMVNFLDYHAPGFLRRKRWSRPLAIVLVYIAGIGLIAGILSSFVPVVVDQARIFAQGVPGYSERFQDLLTYDFTALLEPISPEIQSMVNANLEKASGAILEGVQKGLSATLRTLSQTISFVLGMVIVPFWLFYVLNDEPEARRSFYALVPEQARGDVHCIAVIVDGLLSAYVRGQLLLCLLVGVMVTVVLLILGVDLALLLGTFAGIFELIPFLGPYLGALPAVLIALLERPMLGLWVALAFFAIQQIENLFLVPRIAGSAVRFHPAWVMIVLVVGSQVAGLWGLLLGVPIAAMLRDVFRYLYLRTTERGATPEMALESLRAGSF